MKKVSQKSSGDGIRFGKTTGKTVGQFFVHLMEDQRTKKLDDETLAAIITEEFPGASDNYLYNMRYYRSRYNNGKWPAQCGELPDFVVPIYVNGKPKITHPGRRGKREDK